MAASMFDIIFKDGGFRGSKLVDCVGLGGQSHIDFIEHLIAGIASEHFEADDGVRAIDASGPDIGSVEGEGKGL